ncbi:hypothetical protein [Micromonospora sp. WMMD710]|uniref:hypothetical protein n=1 Tax=Micromonospora sp. WMMD710 TaxID=3016085 RepID=UPI002415D73F|nr:hypothetical protein [Micromonospora sp. WMMD710]MDG4762045.1 hypothetical protein [Micromonospora sp. WMMD710]
MLLIIALSAVHVMLAVQSRSRIDSDVAQVTSAQQGARYLRATIDLLSELTRLRAQAVRNTPANPGALQRVVTELDALDGREGEELGLGPRWSGLRPKVGQLIDDMPTGRQALDRYSEVLTLAVDMAAKVVRLAHLTSSADSYVNYLADASFVQLPIVLIGANLVADQTYLGGGSGSAALVIAVTRAQVAAAAAAIDAGLRDATGAAGHAALVEPLDSFRDTVSRFGDSAPAGTAGARATAANAALVQDASLAVADAMSKQLDRLLKDRVRTLDRLRQQQIALVIGGVLVGLLLLWWAMPGRERESADDRDDEVGADPTADIAAVSVAMPEVDARDLLAAEELLRVGRGVRPRSGDDELTDA